MFKEKGQYKEALEKMTGQGTEIDPHFQRAYGVIVTNPNSRTENPTETRFTQQFAEQFDEDYTEYFENRKATPEKEKQRRKLEDGESSTDSENINNDQAKKVKQLKGEPKAKKRNEEEELVARDNLRIKTMAQFKSLCDGDLMMFTDIENKLIDMATIKGKCFEDSSMEEDEREVDSDLEQRGLLSPEHNFGRRSDNSELHNSIRSSQDYWQKIENKYAKHAARERTLKAKIQKQDEQK